MTERRFLSLVLTEGMLLFVLGTVMLIIPKITTITFGMILCLCFIIYGGYKIINAIMSRNYISHYRLNIVLGVILSLSGLILFFIPQFNLILITSIIGVYFLLESISTIAFAFQNKNILNFWYIYIFPAILQFFIGLTIIMGLPSTAFWAIGILTGINFLISGIILINIYIASKYS